MGIIAQKAALICLALSAIIILAWTQLEKALLLLGEPCLRSTPSSMTILIAMALRHACMHIGSPNSDAVKT